MSKRYPYGIVVDFVGGSRVVVKDKVLVGPKHYKELAVPHGAVRISFSWSDLFRLDDGLISCDDLLRSKLDKATGRRSAATRRVQMMEAALEDD